MIWNASLETGVTQIDDQHKELFRRIDTLLEASKQQRGKEKIAETLLFLEQYVRIHFRDEQLLQQQSRYPAAAQHKALHDQYVRELQELRKQYDTVGENLNMVLSVNRSVVDWLVNHINIHDCAFAQYYKAKQAK